MHSYTDVIELPDGRLKIVLTRKGYNEINDYRERDEWPDFYDFMESHVCNSDMMWIPDGTLALWDNPYTLAKSASYEDDGSITFHSPTFWFDNKYVYRDPIQALWRDGSVIFDKNEVEED
jgi:hypothetical protein